MISCLSNSSPFPPVSQALTEPNGLLAAGGSLTPERLLFAYRHGIFPWFNPGEPILWWSPDPRMVLLPAEFKCSNSLSKILRRGEFEIRMNTSFEQVMRACAAPREGQGTWISEEMISAYCTLHQMGYAQSIETWREDKLVGGLYGISLGQMFYGESMFSAVSNASKIALTYLCGLPYSMIDCQMHTPHLASMGARLMSRNEFIAKLSVLVDLNIAS